MSRRLALALFCLVGVCLWQATPVAAGFPNTTAVDFAYYCTGDCTSTVNATSIPGYVLMGGGTDVDAAYVWMAKRAGGGDFVVIRTDDDALYNPYIYALGAGHLHSVASLCLFNRSAAFHPFVSQVLASAAAVFMAGGDQWTYYSHWKDSPVQQRLLERIAAGIPLGGTSAGEESMGEFVNSGQFDRGTADLTSKAALHDPYTRELTIGTDFVAPLPVMAGILADAHFAQRDRMGRLMAFVARLLTDYWSPSARGIGVDEATALLVDPLTGIADLTSWHANGSAYFVGNYSLTAIESGAGQWPYEALPATCQPHQPLHWAHVPVTRFSGNVSQAFDVLHWRPLATAAAVQYSITAKDGTLKAHGNGGSIY